MPESLKNVKIQPLPGFAPQGITADILRLDLLHPVVSGNKWFKLRYHLREAVATKATSIATFGGAWSNHIVAAAFAASELGIPATGLIRGEETRPLSHTLQDARNFGMELVFIPRKEYGNKALLQQQYAAPGRYWIAEGGYGVEGAKGAGEILGLFDTSAYSHIMCAVGTGTMMAGLINTAAAGQRVEGISVLKGHSQLQNEIKTLLTNNRAAFTVHHDYHFGGYGKHTEAQLGFMNALWMRYGLPTDIVYTSKLVFAASDLLRKSYFPAGSRILLIHSGGLQGNRSLPAGKLTF